MEAFKHASAKKNPHHQPSVIIYDNVRNPLIFFRMMQRRMLMIMNILQYLSAVKTRFQQECNVNAKKIFQFSY